MTLLRKTSIGLAALAMAWGAQAAVTLNVGDSATLGPIYKTTTFSDVWDFTFAGDPPAGLVTFSFFSGGIDFSDLSALVITDSVSTYTFAETDLPTFDTTLTLVGPFSVSITGSPIGKKGGYTLDITEVAAVPEASTYAMMLGGLGVLAWVARRRKESAEA